eukprot:16370035-Heterocapsa_arctica.AAC.1
MSEVFNNSYNYEERKNNRKFIYESMLSDEENKEVRSRQREVACDAGSASLGQDATGTATQLQ